MKEKYPRVLVIADGISGDLRPALAVSRSLVARGASVKALVPGDFTGAFEAEGIEASRISGTRRAFFLEGGEALYSGPLGFYGKSLPAFRGYLEEQFAALLPEAEKADAILASGFVFSAQSVAERFSLPFIHMVYAPVFFPSSEIPPPGFPLARAPRLAKKAAWTAYLALLDAAMLGDVNSLRSRLSLPALRSLKEHLTRPLLLAMDRELFPLPGTYSGEGFRQTSYPFLRGKGSLKPELERFLSAGPAPVYIGFGGMVADAASGLAGRLAEGLRLAGLRAVALSNTMGGLAGEDLFITGEIPHELLFPRMAGIVHHGGTGTARTAMACGLPQLAVPHILEQFVVAERIHSLRIGPKPLSRRRISAASFADALLELTGNPAYASRARELSTALSGRDGADEVASLVLETIAERKR